MTKNISKLSRWVDRSTSQSISGSYTYVPISTGGGGTTDLTNYYTKTQVDASFYTNNYIDASFYTKNYIDASFYSKDESDGRFVNVTGDTMTGDLTFQDIGDGIIFGDGDSKIYEGSDDQLWIDLAGATKLRLATTYLDLYNNNGPRLVKESTSATNPIYSIGSNTSFGIGGVNGDYVSIIADSVEGIRVTSNTNLADYLESKTDSYVSGFTGEGYYLGKNGNEYDLEIDNLRVRGKLNAYELILNKIRATNGALWVSDAVEADGIDGSAGFYWDSDKGFYAFTVAEGLNTLSASDAIRSQQFLGNNVHQLDYFVEDSIDSSIWISAAPTNRNDGGSAAGEMGMTNIDADTFLDLAWGYEIETDYASKQYWKTNDFAIRGKGMLNMNFQWTLTDWDSNATIEWQVFDSNDSSISELYFTLATNEGWSGSITLKDSFNGDPSCYIKFNNYSTDEVDMYVYLEEGMITTLEDLTTAEVDVTGFTFVRMGNKGITNRQGAIYITANDSEAPYIEVLDGMTGHEIGTNERKARIGNLDGLTWNGTDTSSYGLYSSNTYLTGSIYSYGGYFLQIEEATFKTDGDAYGIKINGGHIWEDDKNADDGYVLINMKGYDGGTTKYRRTAIGDGKGNQCWYVNGKSADAGFGINHLIYTKFSDTAQFLDDVSINADLAVTGNIKDPTLSGTTTHTGGVINKVATTTSSSYTLTTSDYMLKFNYATTGGTVYLPTTRNTGQTYIVSNPRPLSMTLNGNSRNFISDGAPPNNTFTLGAYESVMIIYDGADWVILTKYA